MPINVKQLFVRNLTFFFFVIASIKTSRLFGSKQFNAIKSNYQSSAQKYQFNGQIFVFRVDKFYLFLLGNFFFGWNFTDKNNFVIFVSRQSSRKSNIISFFTVHGKHIFFSQDQHWIGLARLMLQSLFIERIGTFLNVFLNEIVFPGKSI